MSTQSYDLDRFVEAQNVVYPRVISELAAGAKRTHWMWFVFPQIAGLGFSVMAQRYAIGSRAEAVAYLAHPILGARLIECTRLVLDVTGKSIHSILGSPDDVKFCSSMTLFDAVSNETIFMTAIKKYYSGKKDTATTTILAGMNETS